ncbi:integrase core domain-containing protein, partial [Escherichia coli]|uniref:integrase core domain-containing protein n=1 Tax=Escherichia coli TaxID=562 RepID=UPI001124D353
IITNGTRIVHWVIAHYNEWHPHSALGYRSPREYLRQQASNGLSDNRCLEI